MKTFLTIAGSDPSGGAGIQADIKTCCANGLYAQSVITAITVQNTRGVSDVLALPAQTVAAQLDAVFTDIFPDCVKIGMCVNAEIISAIADALAEYRPRNVVLDTILVSSSGRRLLSHGAAELMKKRLFPLSDIITPNVPEAEYLTGTAITNENGMETAAARLYDKYGCRVLLKGGHLNGCDVFYDGAAARISHGIIANPNTHGTGCTLSSALAAFLAKGLAPGDAARAASEYVKGAIAAGLSLGSGTGPLDHMYKFNTARQES